MTDLTAKQQQVLDSLNSGQKIAAIAKKMHVTSGAIYGHMRQIRHKGYTIPGEEAPVVANERLAAAIQATNGTLLTPIGDPEESLRAALAEGVQEIENAEATAASLRDQIEGLEKMVGEQAEQNVKYENALAALS